MDKFTIEKNAKNRAYAFIIAMGLFNEFSQFCEETKDIDPHDLCLTTLAMQAE